MFTLSLIAPLTSVGLAGLACRTRSPLSPLEVQRHERRCRAASPPTCGARRHGTPEVERSDSSPRVRNPRSVTIESAWQVYAAIAGVRIAYYSRRPRQGTSRSETSGVRSREADGRHGRGARGPAPERPGAGCQCGTSVRSPPVRHIAAHCYQVNSALIRASLPVRIEFGCSHVPPGTKALL